MKAAFSLSVLAVLSLAAPAAAHHSFAMFDAEVNMTIEGTVTSFEFVNPHSWLYVETTDENGNTAEWSIEMGGPNAMGRAGWSADTVSPGDQISVEIHPLRDGTYGGQYLSAVLADGTEIGGGDTGLPGRVR
jgi:hypothetical protein